MSESWVSRIVGTLENERADVVRRREASRSSFSRVTGGKGGWKGGSRPRSREPDVSAMVHYDEEGRGFVSLADLSFRGIPHGTGSTGRLQGKGWGVGSAKGAGRVGGGSSWGGSTKGKCKGGESAKGGSNLEDDRPVIDLSQDGVVTTNAHEGLEDKEGERVKHLHCCDVCRTNFDHTHVIRHGPSAARFSFFSTPSGEICPGCQETTRMKRVIATRSPNDVATQIYRWRRIQEVRDNGDENA